MRWVRFADRLPPHDGPNEYVCVRPDGHPFIYHVFLDEDGITETENYYWLEGLTVPHVAEPKALRIPRHIPTVPEPSAINQEPPKPA